MVKISVALEAINTRIAKAASKVGRQPTEILLLAASKTNPASQIREAWLAGQTIFGENYLQEALEKYLHSLIYQLNGTSLVPYKVTKQSV